MSETRKRSLQASESRPAYPRKRAAQACLTCRRRRTKCDNEQPACTSCTKLRVECVYREIDKASFDPASLAILQRLDDLEVLYKACHSNAGPSPVLEYSSAPSIGLDLDHTPETRFVNVEAVLSWPVLGIESVDRRQELLSLLHVRDTNGDLRPRLAADVSSKEASELLQLFLTHFHIYNPVLDVPKIQEHMRYTVLNGLEWDAQSCLLLLIYALGAIMSENPQVPFETSVGFRQTAHFQRAEAFFLAAQKRMGPLLFGRGITEAQVFFLAGVYLMTTMRPVEAWKTFVQALTCCQTFQSSAADALPEEAQLQHGIYWTCFKSELELRMELGMTETSVWNLRYPAAYPEPPRYLHAEGEPAWYFYLAEIALRRLENRVLMSTCQVIPRGNALLERLASGFEFERQANSWADSLPEPLQIKDGLNSLDALDDSNQNFRFILRGHFLDCLEMIYWPFCEGAVLGDLTDEPDCNILASKGFDVCVRRIEENQLGFCHRHHGTWLMLRSCTRSAFVLVAAARSGFSERLPQRWQAAVEKVVDLLRYWKDEVPDAADRLAVLEDLAPGL